MSTLPTGGVVAVPPTLSFGESAPESPWFLVFQGILAALPRDGALGAQCGGALMTTFRRVIPLSLLGEEDVGVLASATGAESPGPGFYGRRRKEPIVDGGDVIPSPRWRRTVLVGHQNGSRSESAQRYSSRALPYRPLRLPPVNRPVF